MAYVSVIFPVLLVIVGGACALVLVNQKTLRDSRDDLEKRVKQLEDERNRDKETIASQAAEILIWQKTVTGEVHLVAISDLLTQHHNDATKNWNHVGQTLDHVDSTLAELVTATREGQDS